MTFHFHKNGPWGLFSIRLFCAALILLMPSVFSSAGTPIVHVITVDGAINPSSAEQIHSAIERAAGAGAECLIIRLNTPGGLLKSTRVIVSDMLASPIPVVVYVAPGGSQAASAGVFVTLAANIAVMAPGTNIGAAHPVTVGEQMDSVMMQKATNDAAAFIRTISEKRNRNVQWAEDAVRKSLSITESEALKNNVIDTIAANLTDLLSKIDGREVETSGGVKTLRTAGAEIVEIQVSFQQRILSILSDPNVAYILMMLGIYGLLFELYNPGAVLPGVVGVISIVLAFYSFHTLPINYAGLALIVFAVVLFIIDLKVTSHGVLTVGGIVSLILGSLMLIQTESALDIVGISWEVIVITVILTAAFFIFAIGMGIRAQRLKPSTGAEGIIGETGDVITDLRPEGTVMVHGEIWNATSTEGTIRKGSRIIVEGTKELKLNVRKSTT